jgi:tetratricopeptide (TPR) repeat protein
LAVHSLKNIPQLWTDNKTSSFIPENRVYRPLTFTFFAIAWSVGHGATWPFHLMKMLFHALVALALFLIWRRLFREPGWFPSRELKIRFPWVGREQEVTPEWAALLLAAIFAIHPACSEIAIYISATTSLLAAMFYAWAFYAYLCFRDSRARHMLALSLFLYFCAVASKEEAITLPPVIVLLELLMGKETALRRCKEALRRSLPFWIAFIPLLTWWYLMRSVEGERSHGYVTPWHYFMTEWREYLWYMRLWFWPWGLNADDASTVFATSFFDPLVIQALIGNAALILFAWCQRKRFPAFIFGLAWFYITISPASSVLPLAEATNEHRMYLSYVGFAGGAFAVLLWCAENFLAPKTRAKRFGWTLSFAILGLAIGTHSRNRVWLTAENLWTDTVEKNPNSGRALNNLALVYMGRADYARAVELLDRCEQVWASYMYCPLNKGISLQAMGRLDEAERAYLRAYRLDPKSVHANYHLGRFYDEARRDPEKGQRYYLAAVELSGGRYPEADFRAAKDLMALKRYGAAESSLRRALEVEPSNQDALFELGKLQYETARIEPALESYRKLLTLNPNHSQAWYNLGVIQLAQRKPAQAKEAFEHALHLDPGNSAYRNELQILARTFGETGGGK